MSETTIHANLKIFQSFRCPGFIASKLRNQHRNTNYLGEHCDDNFTTNMFFEKRKQVQPISSENRSLSASNMPSARRTADAGATATATATATGTGTGTETGSESGALSLVLL